jgi:hypothetical protein
MGKRQEQLSPKLTGFIKEQKIFFVGTARSEGTVNISPKGMDSFRVISPQKVVWLNLTGSGNETATHLLENNRMTIMFTAFEGSPMILRLYGKAKVYHPRNPKFDSFNKLFKPSVGARQIIEMDIDLVQSSCGYSVPLMTYTEDRDILTKWNDRKGEEGVKEYWKENNAISLDGFETEILKD